MLSGASGLVPGNGLPGVGSAGGAGQRISPVPLPMYWLKVNSWMPLWPDGAPAPRLGGRCALPPPGMVRPAIPG